MKLLASDSIWQEKDRNSPSEEAVGQGRGRDLECRFVDALANLITEALRISYRDQEITKRFIYSSIEDIVKDYLEAYLNGNLEILAKSINREFGIDKKVNYNYALHAKFNDIVEEIKGLFKKEK